MLRSPKRSRSLTRIAVGLVALGVPLLGASAAQGNIGTSVAFTGPEVNRPVLTSVSPGLPGLVRYCFFTNNGAAVQPFGGGSYDTEDFWLGGYEDDNDLEPDSVNQATNQCVVASFSEGQLSQYTYGGVLEDSVEANVTGSPQGNEEDSSPFNVPAEQATKNGTRGFSTGPDLQTILRGADVGGNRLAFIFDQNVDEDELCPDTPCFTTDFWFYSGDGDLHGDFPGAVIISISDNVVVVDYSGTSEPPFNDAVADARIALVQEHADSTGAIQPGGFPTADAGRLRSDTPTTSERLNPMLSVAVPGSNGNTAGLDFVSAETVAGGDSNQINFTFDGTVALTTRGLETPGDCFIAVISNQQLEPATSAVVSGNTVTATFAGGDGLETFSEMAIAASVQEPDDVDPGGEPDEPPCVQSTTGQVPNTMGGKPVGGNVGAVGTGYTTGPDALGLSRGTGAGTLRMRIDQRAEQDDIGTSCIRLIDDQGAPFGPPPGSAAVEGNGSPYDPHVVTLAFDPDAASQAAGLQLLGDPHLECPSGEALETFDGDVFGNEDNASQVFGFGGLTG